MRGSSSPYVVCLVFVTTALASLLIAPSRAQPPAQRPYYEFYGLAVSPDIKPKDGRPTCPSAASTIQSGQPFSLVFCWRVYQLPVHTIIHYEYAIRTLAASGPARTVYSRREDRELFNLAPIVDPHKVLGSQAPAMGSHSFPVTVTLPAGETSQDYLVVALARWNGVTKRFSIPLRVVGAMTQPGPQAPFSFDSIRVQLAKDDTAPSLSRVRSGQSFYIIFVSQLSGQAPITFNYRFVDSSGKAYASDINPFYPRGTSQGPSTYGNVFDPISIDLEQGVREKTYTIIGLVTMAGRTQRRESPLTVFK